VALLVSGCLAVLDEKAHPYYYVGENELVHNTLDVKGLPIAVSLITFCVGGHGAYPKIFHSMQDSGTPSVRRVLFATGLSLCAIYCVILSVGYFFYGQYTSIPVTLDIGRSISGDPLIGASALQLMAAFSIVVNLQVTCPLVIFPLRGMVNSILSSTCKNGAHDTVALSTVIVVIIAVLTATVFENSFASICAVCGMAGTTINSLVLPIYFYHQVCEDKISPRERILHFTMLTVGLCCSAIGLYTVLKPEEHNSRPTNY
jgi:amino acid permease